MCHDEDFTSPRSEVVPAALNNDSTSHRGRQMQSETPGSSGKHPIGNLNRTYVVRDEKNELHEDQDALKKFLT